MTHRAEQERSPTQTGAQRRSAHVVHVVAIPVVGRADRDDRLQRRRAARRDLQRVEPAPGNAHHADGAIAPGLRRQPRDDLERVVLLLLGVLIGQQAVRFAAASDIDTDGRHSHGRQDRDASARRGHTVPVRLRYGRYSRIAGTRILAGVRRQPDARGQVRAVTQRDQRVLNLAHRAGKLGDDQVLIRLGAKCGHGTRIRARSRSHCAEDYQPGRK